MYLFKLGMQIICVRNGAILFVHFSAKLQSTTVK